MIYRYAQFSNNNPIKHKLAVTLYFVFFISCCVLATGTEEYGIIGLGGAVITLPLTMFFKMASDYRRHMPQ